MRVAYWVGFAPTTIATECRPEEGIDRSLEEWMLAEPIENMETGGLCLSRRESRPAPAHSLAETSIRLQLQMTIDDQMGTGAASASHHPEVYAPPIQCRKTAQESASGRTRTCATAWKAFEVGGQTQ